MHINASSSYLRGETESHKRITKKKKRLIPKKKNRRKIKQNLAHSCGGSHTHLSKYTPLDLI